jgi:DNA-binding NarL/FixJ family response regulator
VLVDDTEDLRYLMKIILERAGYAVVGEAADGAAGIEAVRQHRPDLVLLDVSMPVMDGLTALPFVRDIVPTACIVVFSGFGSTDLAEQAVAAGADAYLQKGLSVKQIVEQIGTFVEESSLGA